MGELRVRRGLARMLLLLLLAAGFGWGAPSARSAMAAAETAAETAAQTAAPAGEPLVEAGVPTPEATVLLTDPAGPPVPPPPPANFVPVLVYHHFLPEAIASTYNSELIVSTENFTDQMRLLSEGGYHTITTGELAAWLLRGEALPPKSVLITFDDGYESQYVYALPILKKFGLKATLFIISGDVGEANPPYNPRVLSSMDWRELKAMAGSGLIDVEDHTHHMHHLVKGRAAAFSLSAQAVLDDLALSRRLLATHLDGPQPMAFAFPRGEYDARYVDLVGRAGFELAFSTDSRGPVRQGDNPYALRRIGVFRHHWIGTFRRMVDGLYSV